MLVQPAYVMRHLSRFGLVFGCAALALVSACALGTDETNANPPPPSGTGGSGMDDSGTGGQGGTGGVGGTGGTVTADAGNLRLNGGIVPLGSLPPGNGNLKLQEARFEWGERSCNFALCVVGGFGP